MISASIKVATTKYLQALQQLALINLQQPCFKIKLTTIPFYNFVCTMIDILIDYAKSTIESNSHNLNTFIIDYYFRKYQNNQSQIYRQLISFLRSWKKYIQHHEQAKLFLSLLTAQRNTKKHIKQFLKYRKCVLKSLNQKILQQINVTHQDALAIIHTLFFNDFKVFVVKKINQMFISLKCKLINSAIINGAVLCEFFLKSLQLFQKQSINNLFNENMNKNNKNNKIISPSLQCTTKIRRPLQIREQQEQYKTQNQNNKRNMKYNLSFSQQFASYYSPNVDNNNSFKISNLFENHQNLNKQLIFKEKQIHGADTFIYNVKDSISYLKKKDMEIDRKLNKTHDQFIQQIDLSIGKKYF